MKLPDIEPYLDKSDYRQAVKPKATFIVNKNTETATTDLGREAIERACRIVAEAERKHDALNKAAFTLGGYVAGNLVNEDDAFNALKDAIDSRDCVSYSDAYTTIKKALRDGQGSPITAEMEEESRKVHARALSCTLETPQVADIKSINTDSAQSARSAQPKTSEFPVSAFPARLQAIIKSAKEGLGFSPEYMGCSMLGVSSVAIGNTHRISPKNGWQEPAILTIALVGRPGANKSHPLSFALSPIHDRDAITKRSYDEAMTEFTRVNALTKKERMGEGLDGSPPVKPRYKKLIISDATQEAVASVQEHNKRGVILYADELAGYINNMNRYNGGGEEQFWLSVWSGKPVIVDRKTSEPILISHPFISVIGTIQNGVLEDMAKGRQHNGFLDRILFAIPANDKKEYWSDSEIDPIIRQDWFTILSNLLNLVLPLDAYGSPSPVIAQYDEDALKLLKQWQKKNTDTCNQSESETLASIYTKLEVYAIRLSLIMHLLRWACQDEARASHVSKQSVEAALQLIEYFRSTATYVYQTIHQSTPVDKMPSNQRQLYEALPEVFTTAIGLVYSKKAGLSDRFFKKILGNKELFERLKHGEYKKLL